MAAEQDTLVDVDVGSDDELFNQALADDSPAETPVADATVEKPEGQPRDEHGRFATPEKVEEAPPVAEQPVLGQEPDKQIDHRVPLVELLNTRDRAQKAEARAQEVERQLQQLQRANQPKPEPVSKPDPLLDPEGYMAFVEQTMSERLLSQQRDFDLRMAQSRHGKLFDEAYAEAQQALSQGDAALRAMMLSAASPGEALISWHQQRKVTREVGNDPLAYKQRVLDEALKDPAYLAKAIAAAQGAAAGNVATQGKPNIALPPSLTRAVQASAHTGDPSDNDVSDEGLWNYATR